MFEHKRQKLLPWPRFARRMLLSFLLAAAIVGVALAPIFHRILHKFHLDEADESTDQK